MLWLLPSHIAVSFFLLKKQKPSWLKFYFLFTAGFMLLLFIVWPWNPQPFNLAVAPLVLLLAFRAFNIYCLFMKK